MQISHTKHLRRDLKNASVRPQLRQVGHRIAGCDGQAICPVMQVITYGGAGICGEADVGGRHTHAGHTGAEACSAVISWQDMRGMPLTGPL
jgi:hypothetical protein